MPFDRSLYPENWKEISDEIRFVRAAGRCEWIEGGKRCEARHLKPHPITGSKVILTTAHLNHVPMDVERTNLMAMCQLHHLRYDSKFHAENMKKKKAVRAAEFSKRMEGKKVQRDKPKKRSYHQSTSENEIKTTDQAAVA